MCSNGYSSGMCLIALWIWNSSIGNNLYSKQLGPMKILTIRLDWSPWKLVKREEWNDSVIWTRSPVSHRRRSTIEHSRCCSIGHRSWCGSIDHWGRGSVCHWERRSSASRQRGRIIVHHFWRMVLVDSLTYVCFCWLIVHPIWLEIAQVGHCRRWRFGRWRAGRRWPRNVSLNIKILNIKNNVAILT